MVTEPPRRTSAFVQIAADQDGGIVLPEPPDALRQALVEGGAIAWEEPVVIRTYEPSEPSRYPMYFERRVYQGSSGKVYPMPFIEGISDDPVLRTWRAVHLENAYLRVMVMPELGGRIHIGYDKTTDYDFFYRNNVIKPALVGLAGPWVSGGVEFNWPQHHRPTTHTPVDTTIETDEDGAVTVWCHDHDPFSRMSAQHGVRLKPGDSTIELVVRLHNRTKERHTFLWWANVAAPAHEDYQSFFPQDVRFVADHARRAITAFPAADRPYYGVDYPALAELTPGVDRIDWYRNIPVPTSYMVVDSEQDFFGGYDHAAQAGFVHWCERRISPGKKQWTWGNSSFGRAWNGQLTDSDDPYVELMAGVYTDNQPDFAWVLPGETKTFVQYWYPIPGIGPVHQATPDAAVHVERGDTLTASFAVTRQQPAAVLRVIRDGDVLVSRTADLVPGVAAHLDADVSGDDIAGQDIAVELLDAGGRTLVRWTPPVVVQDQDPPWVATEPPQPGSIRTVEELYLTGVHLSQYRHPTRSPIPYWTAALSLDPGDVRTNLAMADHHYRKGEYAEAADRARVALQRLTRRNANPIDAEAFYLLGLALRRLGQEAEAEQAFGKAGWDGTWAPAAGFALAQSLAKREKNRAALRVLDTLDGVVGHDVRRAALRVIVLRRLGLDSDAQRALTHALAEDPLDATLRSLHGDEMTEDGGTLLDIAIDLRDGGAGEEALGVLRRAATAGIGSSGNVRPLAHYLAAAILDDLNRPAEAEEQRRAARVADLVCAFPHGLDAHDALTMSLKAEPDDGVAHYLLGTLLYSHGRRREATWHWERAIELGVDEPVLMRNAALGAYNVGGDGSRAWEHYERAIRLAPDDARLWYEQDQLAARLGRTPRQRLERLRPVETVVLSRDDLAIEYAGLLVAEGDAARAHEILTSRTFHPWEGGEGKVIAVWDATRAALGVPPAEPPANLGEARPQFAPPATRSEDGEIDYFATSLPEHLLFWREPERE